MTEQQRLTENAATGSKWHRWGPYLSERQWGTVREDYSADGSAWDYFPHDHARSRAYRWGEDGLLGICDRHGLLNCAVALWNGKDPILKERLFGLTNSEGNHGEDVKEAYWFLDNTPTHSYMKALYKYPQAAYPYEELVRRNGTAGRSAPEFELTDTGIFDESRYFDVFVEYAKASPNEVLGRITVHNRGPEDAPIWVLPTVWYRNTWSWRPDQLRPGMTLENADCIFVDHPRYDDMWFSFDEGADIVFTENDSNLHRLFGVSNPAPYVKDSFHRYLLEGETGAVNPAHAGTKAAAIYHATVPSGGSATFRFMLSDSRKALPSDFERVFDGRIREADQFYESIAPNLAPEVQRVQRQAFAGMLWSKQYYHFDVKRWLEGDPYQPKPPDGRNRNGTWRNIHAAEVLSMPDTWEYPWFASWDLAFHTIPFALIDPKFAKSQLILLLREWYQHPNGQIPAYEWSFSDVNPPVHAWAAWRIYTIERRQTGVGDTEFLQRVFHKLLLNFTWWVNRKDELGNNVFEGGFLGLDNIGVFDRNRVLPDGCRLEQSDGTSWMALFCLNMLEIALELATHDRAYEDVASKFFEHFMYVATAMNSRGDDGVELWDDEDGFYYDVLRRGGGQCERIRARSVVGLVPLFAVTVLDPTVLEMFPGFRRRMQWFLDNRPDLTANVASMQKPGQGERFMLTTVRKERLERVLRRFLDPNEFLADHGLRGVSKYYEANPYSITIDGETFGIDYEPAESTTGSFGGNSNWRGPIWFPLNYLMIESLQKYDYYYGDSLQVPMPYPDGKSMTLGEVAAQLEHRLLTLFLPDSQNRRPFNGGIERFDTDPNWKDLIQFNEYFCGNTGKGLGASHQTGWTGVIAKIIQQLYIAKSG
ncbi:MAG: hypothetical protein P4L46_14430 [Fimbriimonas sp.]|nr:hypothetical protein [Fimbriimonas sp.]